jgi:hypothetical protein
MLTDPIGSTAQHLYREIQSSKDYIKLVRRFMMGAVYADRSPDRP